MLITRISVWAKGPSSYYQLSKLKRFRPIDLDSKTDWRRLTGSLIVHGKKQNQKKGKLRYSPVLLYWIVHFEWQKCLTWSWVKTYRKKKKRRKWGQASGGRGTWASSSAITALCSLLVGHSTVILIVALTEVITRIQKLHSNQWHLKNLEMVCFAKLMLDFI